jgi:hypothetical protein
VTHEEIRQSLSGGCSEEELKAIHCPVCDCEVTFHVHARRRMFFIRCVVDTTHMAMHGVNPASPEWWQNYVDDGGWLS